MWPFTRWRAQPAIDVVAAQELIRARELSLGRQPGSWYVDLETRDHFVFESLEDMDSEAIVDRQTGAVTLRYGDD